MGTTVMLYHGFPPETDSTVGELADRIERSLSTVDLVRTSDYTDAAALISDAEIVIEHGIPNELLAAGSSLQWVQSLSAGVNRYDLAALEERGVLLTTVSGAHAQPAAEHVLGTMLYFERNLRRAVTQQQAGHWRRFAPGELGNKTVGIIGLGAIGGRVAELTAALGMTVLATKRDTSVYNDVVDEVYGTDGLHRMLGAADYVVVACPLTDETKGLLGTPEFASMNNDAVLVNVARGKIIVQDELVQALQEGYLGGAVLDVTDPEPLPADSALWAMDNVVLTPHLAGGSPVFARRCADTFVSNFNAYTAGNHDELHNRVL